MPVTNQFIVPRFFTARPQFPYLQVDTFSYVEYRSRSNHYRNQVLTTSYLFTVILSGEKIIHTANGDLHITKGDAFFAQKGTYIFSEILASHDEYKALIFFIDDSFLEHFLRHYGPAQSLQAADRAKEIFPIPVSPLFEVSINSVIPFFQHPTDLSQQLLQLKLTELLLHCIDADHHGNFIGFLHSQYSTRKQELRSLIDRYCLKRVTITELAKLSGRSLSAFKRDFWEAFTDTPRHWIANRRLDQARLLLTGSNLQVGEVCLQVGFDSFSHFSFLFKKKFGISPSSFKKAHN